MKADAPRHAGNHMEYRARTLRPIFNFSVSHGEAALVGAPVGASHLGHDRGQGAIRRPFCHRSTRFGDGICAVARIGRRRKVCREGLSLTASVCVAPSPVSGALVQPSRHSIARRFFIEVTTPARPDSALLSVGSTNERSVQSTHRAVAGLRGRSGIVLGRWFEPAEEHAPRAHSDHRDRRPSRRVQGILQHARAHQFNIELLPQRGRAVVPPDTRSVAV